MARRAIREGLLGLGQVEVTVIGEPVLFEPSPNTRAMDLSDTDHAHLMGRFYLSRYVRDSFFDGRGGKTLLPTTSIAQ